VLILLPPSEGKAPTDRGRPFDRDALSLPELGPTRERVLNNLVRLCAGRESRAREVLGLSVRQTEELDRNRKLAEPRALPAAVVYNGVLYAALDYSSLPAAARRRADRWILVFSGLWGAVHLHDAIPSYRLSGDVRLPRLGSVANLWRPALAKAIPDAAGSGVILDLRSGTYAKMWTPTDQLAEQTVVARVMQQRPDGARVVVSHHNKATKGRLVRSLARQTKTPRTIESLAGLIESQGVGVELRRGHPGRPWQLDVVVGDL
jgi:cytoplasmic iron level regulating protein YaaA (DUF328/UPF0246 family)